jgi:hypothetical protein
MNFQAQEAAMAVKKKKKATKTKRVVSRRKKAAAKRPKARASSFTAPPQPFPQPEQESGLKLWPLILVVALGVGIFLMIRSSQSPAPTKVSAGLQQSPEASPAEAQNEAAKPAPQKRASTPTGPRIWDRSKSKTPVRFYVLREEGSLAEVRIFKAGNQLVLLLRSEKGPRRTVELRWDGKDSSGKDAAPGLYYARISGAHGDIIEEIRLK